MALIDTKARGKKEAEAIVKKMTKMIKAASPYFDVEASFYGVDGRQCSVQANNDRKLAFELSSFVHNSKFCKLIDFQNHAGHFDWAADTYIKDCSIIEFEF